MDELKKNESFKERLNIERKQTLAEKLKSGEVDLDDLNDEQIDEMIQFFYDSIEQKDIEIERIKESIIEMKRKMDNNI